jgi:hypothetical protein
MKDVKELIVRAIISGEMKELNPHCEGQKFQGFVKSVAEASVALKKSTDVAGAVAAADALNSEYAKLAAAK